MFESGDDVSVTYAEDIEKLAGSLRSAAVVGSAAGHGAPSLPAEIVDGSLGSRRSRLRRLPRRRA